MQNSLKRNDPRNFLKTKEGKRFLKITTVGKELTLKEISFATEFLGKFLIFTHGKDPRQICNYQEAQFHILRCDHCKLKFRTLFPFLAS